MQISTKAQGPLGLGGTTIEGDADIANFTPAENWRAHVGGPAWLTTAIADRLLDEAVERELQGMTQRIRNRLRAQAGVPVVPAHAVIRAAESVGVRAQIETWITNNAANPLAIRLRYGAENITQAELVSASPAQGAAIFTAALAL